MVRHGKDQLDRLLESYDEDNNVSIATYVYRGPRSSSQGERCEAVERTYGNGTRTSYTYESSGCHSSSSETKSGEVCYNASDTETSSAQYVYGKGQSTLVHELADNGSTTVERYRHEDQAGSLIGVTDETGHATDEYFYQDFGTPVHRPILFEGGIGDIQSIYANTPSSGYTRLALYSSTLTADAFNGKQARVIGSLHLTEVYDNGTSTIDIVDPTGSLFTLLLSNLHLEVLDFESPATETLEAGIWTDVYYDDLNGWTVFEDTGASFTSTTSIGGRIQAPSLN